MERALAEEFVKRAGFVLMAALAVHDKKAPDGRFREFLPLIEREAVDERNFVKKAVNWALRQIGKRNRALNRGRDSRGETNSEDRFEISPMDRRGRAARARKRRGARAVEQEMRTSLPAKSQNSRR